MKKYQMNIELKYENIVNNFSDNHNRQQYFRNDDVGYWELINKAVVVAVRMAKHYMEKTSAESEYDKLVIGGGGGGNEVYSIYASHHQGIWTLPVGKVNINFKTKEITVNYGEHPESNVKYKYNEIPYKKFIDLGELEELN